MTHYSLRFATQILLCVSLALFACDSKKESGGGNIDTPSPVPVEKPEVLRPKPEPEPEPEPEPPQRPRPSKQTLEMAVHNYLTKNFTTMMTIFTYAGNVDIQEATEKEDGGYYLEGEFDYDNALEIRVKRKFRTTLKIFLEEYTVDKFEFYTNNLDEWLWVEI